ncbi:hypothetical protein AAY473_032177 [Plecturocebus cupreus]
MPPGQTSAGAQTELKNWGWLAERRNQCPLCHVTRHINLITSGQVQWLTPIIPAFWEAEAGRSPEPNNYHGQQTQNLEFISTKVNEQGKRRKRMSESFSSLLNFTSPSKEPLPHYKKSLFWECPGSQRPIKPSKDEVSPFDQAGLKLLTSGDPPASASQSAGITGMSHPAQPIKTLEQDLMSFWVAENKEALGESREGMEAAHLYPYTLAFNRQPPAFNCDHQSMQECVQVSSQHSGKLTRVDHLRSEVQDQPGQHGETPSPLKIQKLARHGNGYLKSLLLGRLRQENHFNPRGGGCTHPQPLFRCLPLSNHSGTVWLSQVYQTHSSTQGYVYLQSPSASNYFPPNIHMAGWAQWLMPVIPALCLGNKSETPSQKKRKFTNLCWASLKGCHGFHKPGLEVGNRRQ